MGCVCPSGHSSVALGTERMEAEEGFGEKPHKHQNVLSVGGPLGGPCWWRGLRCPSCWPNLPSRYLNWGQMTFSTNNQTRAWDGSATEDLPSMWWPGSTPQGRDRSVDCRTHLRSWALTEPAFLQAPQNLPAQLHTHSKSICPQP